MEINDVIGFFDRCAPAWDAEMVRSDEIISAILDCGGIAAGQTVLDVACGTGVLFPDYLGRDVKEIVGIDISPEMARIAAAKFEAYPQIRVVCQNVLAYEPGRRFDRIVVYNAFPHFFEPERLIAHLSGLLTAGGRLTIAHGMSRERINLHHHASAHAVSLDLMSAEALATMMGKYLSVDPPISDCEKYIVTGMKCGE